MPGYSATPLISKLGIRPEMKLHLINAPGDYLRWLGPDIPNELLKTGKAADFVHLFVQSRKELERHFHSLIKVLQPEAIVWISWYKKSSGIATDITEDVIREVILPTGWVDIKVCAVSDEWSGLKFVRRKELR